MLLRPATISIKSQLENLLDAKGHCNVINEQTKWKTDDTASGL